MSVEKEQEFKPEQAPPSSSSSQTKSHDKKMPSSSNDSGKEADIKVVTPSGQNSNQEASDSSQQQQQQRSNNNNTTKKNASSFKGKVSGKNSNLSELARQLRVMQAKNQTLTVEIGRLERQLRIVAELSGVSVAELRGTLQRACESEAYGELQHRLESMQAQLEEAKLKQRKAAEFDRETEAKNTANLQLRIGELEEAEGALRSEIGHLYKSQDEQAEEATKLKVANDQQTEEIKRLKEQIEQLESTNKKLVHQAKSPVGSSSKRKLKDPPAHQSDKHATAKKAIPAAPLTDKVKESPTKTLSPKKPPPAAPLAEEKTTSTQKTLPEAPLVEKGTKEVPTVDAKARAPTLNTKPPPPESILPAIDNKHVQLLRKQVESREKELALKESQYKTRFSLQEERIVDMEQQLSSLYKAFEMLDQEHSQDQKAKEELTLALRMADSQVAKAVDHLQRSTPKTKSQPVDTSSPLGHDPAKVPTSPVSSSGYAVTPATAARSSSITGAPPQQKPGANSADEVLVSGYVMKRTRFNRWNKKHASLNRGFANFQLRLSDAPGLEGSRKKPSVFILEVFRASFEPTREFSNYPYAFRIKTDKNSQELILAVKKEKEFNLWVAGLHEAVNGTVSPVVPRGMMPRTGMPSTQFAPGIVTPPRSQQDGDGRDFAASSSDNDSDLEAALAESLRLSQEGPGAQQQKTGATPPPPPPSHFEETKEEIRDASASDADLEAALAASLLVSNQANEVNL